MHILNFIAIKPCSRKPIISSQHVDTEGKTKTLGEEVRINSESYKRTYTENETTIVVDGNDHKETAR